ncbi:MAG TPA: AraC family transcriptional regulator [Gemmatimonadaceae bacterium]|nr:AraC family transcriptional regulator [Gemmatimonadaceae bacterium]
MKPLDQIVFSTDSVIAAKFRVGPRDPRFNDCGPTGHHLVTFPRTSVWIRYAGSRSFIADPTISTIYNPGQEYTRTDLSGDGDRCDWLGVSPDIAREIARGVDPAAADHEHRVFAREAASVDNRLYLSQRRFFTQLEHGKVDALEAEEKIIAYVATVIRNAYGTDRMETPTRSDDAHRDLVQRARAAISTSLGDNVSLTRLASRLGVSPFHLCRVFRDQTGMTLHAFRLELRGRVALEKMAVPRADLSRVALELGFSSHSHFTSTLRARYGRTPSAIRQYISDA